MKKTFEEKVKSMSAAQIIRAMIRGLKKQHVKVDMVSFGHLDEGVCYGCAATNCVLEIYNKEIERPIFGLDAPFDEMAKTVGATGSFITDFERAIDCLRTGDVEGYNRYADGVCAHITRADGLHLPYLYTATYLDNLAPYEQLAQAQERKDATN